MRDELRNLNEKDYWIYGLSERDFSFTTRLADEFVSARQDSLDHRVEELKKNWEEGVSEEIVSDLAHYNHIDVQYLWQFVIWRMQGILEGLIVYSFLPAPPDRPLLGLKAKLDAMDSAGYQLTNEDREELLEWANLRNAMSHAPPEQFRPGPLKKEDTEDFKMLVERVCPEWRSQQEAMGIGE